MLKRTQEAEIVRLYHAEKWKVGTIARQLGTHHTTVRRVLEREGGAPMRVNRPSIVDPYVPLIRETLEKYPKLPASRLFQMARERGYQGSPDHFRRAVAQYRPRRVAEAYLRLRTLPGEQAQVDWGHFGKLHVGQALRPLMAFVVVLSWSRRIFLRFYLDARMPSFLHGHVSAFEAFGGVPRVLLYDNLKSAVLERRGDAVRFNPTLLELAAHYRYEPRPVAVARGNEKGRVERAIRYVRSSFFAGREFTDLDDLNEQANTWCTGQASDRRCPEDERMTVREAYEQEHEKLLKLPGDAFCCDERMAVSVGKTPFVRFDLNDYSVPAAHVNKQLVVMADLERIRIFDGTSEVASYPRSWNRRDVIEDPAHVEQLTEFKRKAREHRGLDRLYHATPSSRLLMRGLAEQGKNLGGATLRLLQILDRVGADELESAIAEAVRRNTRHLAAVHHILEHRRRERAEPPAVNLHLPDDPRVHDPVVRHHPLTDYDQLGGGQDD